MNKTINLPFSLAEHTSFGIFILTMNILLFEKVGFHRP